MSQSVIPPDVSTQLATFSPTDTAIAELADQYLGLTIDGLEDTEGYQRVHAARMDVKGKRVQIERVRKELKRDALEYGRKVDGEAKRLTALLAPIEEHLLAEEKAIDDEKARIKEEARLKAEAEERAKREAEEAERRRKQEEEEARLRAERERLEKERQAIEAEKAKAAREKAEAEAEKARLEAEEEAKRRAEAMRPDREKLLAVAEAVDNIAVPDVSELSHPEDCEAVRREIATILKDAAGEIRVIVDEL